MARFVYLEDVTSKMADYAPPAWCKLALHGALLTERVSLFAARGRIRAYIPPYHLREADSILPPMIRGERNPDYLIKRFDLQDHERPNTNDITIWDDEWDQEARQIALGWLMFTPEFDWSLPSINLDYFEIPRDFETFFAHDDIHPESEPDSALYYEACFDRLCLSLQDAEMLVPMARFEGEAFAQAEKIGRGILGRPGGSGYHAEDEPIVQKMLADHQADPSIKVRQLAKRYVSLAVGAGTPESILKRLERRFKAAL